MQPALRPILEFDNVVIPVKRTKPLLGIGKPDALADGAKMHMRDAP